MSENKVVFLKKKKLYLLLFSVFAVSVILIEVFGIKLVSDPLLNDLLYGTITRLLGAGICLLMMSFCSFLFLLSPKQKVSITSLLILIPCWLVVVNNFPFIPVLRGTAYLSHPWQYVALFALQCFGQEL